MKYSYIIKITNVNIFKEIQLSPDETQVKIGIGTDCNYRFYREQFFEDFYIRLTQTDDEWQISCSGNIYISSGDVRKIANQKLQHGDSFSVRYRKTDNELFTFDFLLDFGSSSKSYNRIIDISEKDKITIGNSQYCDIQTDSEYMKNDRLTLSNISGRVYVEADNTTFGAYHDGKEVSGKENVNNGDFISIAEYSFYYKNGKLMTSKDVVVNGLDYYDEYDKNGYPKFNRNTRIKQIIDNEKINVMDPPAIPQKPKNNIITRLLPSIVMVGAAVIMGVMSGGSMIIFSIISGLMGVVTGIVSIVEGNKEYKKNSEDRIEKYNRYIDNKRHEIEEYRQTEKDILEQIYIDENTEMARFDEFSSNLFDRNPADDDFLTVRLGTGSLKAQKEISYKQQEKLEVEDELQEMPKQLCDNYEYIDNAPITCSLKDINALGIIGDPVYRFSMMKNIVIDLCARQYHSDIDMYFIAEEENRVKVEWLRFLPQVNNDDTGVRNIAFNDESKSYIFEYLYKECTYRTQNEGVYKPIVVFLYDEYGFRNHPVSKFVNKAKEINVTFVFFSDTKSNVPLGCDNLIDIKDNSNATLIDASDAGKSTDFVYRTIDDAQAKAIVRLLAPVYTEEVSLEGSLTKNISLFQLLNIIAADDIDLMQNWMRSKVEKTMAAPIGVSKNNVVSLDIHDKAHGPHGLVAGTTGSGKSEILQTYILSMSLLFHPHEVSFMIIDFKGGGMANQFRNLPHLLGAITNIDGKEINRSLKSIKAELQKRQRLFAEADVNHINKYIQKYKAGEISVPLPHLIIIVDEFAELKAEQPEFMKELISASRIGRSLGVHLILATQKPAGQVSEQIWSNSRFKLCLKVQSQEDSNEVIKSPLAAEIKEAGRAYFQVGNDEIFELFQSAYSGAPEKTDDSTAKEFTIYGFDDAGRRMPVYVQKKEKGQSEKGGITQLEAIVKHISGYCEEQGIEKLPDICMPSLPEMINFSEPDKTGHDELGTVVDIGIYDDPDNQYQGSYSIDLAAQNLMMIGSSQSGKTNLLQVIIKNLAFKYSPEEVNIYIIDFASMVLKNFETLAHVGGVVTPSEDEKLKNLFKLLYAEVEGRKAKLLSAGVSSFTAYKEAGNKDLPHIVLMIDNLTALKELYFQDDDELLGLCREGLSVGVTVIISNSQTAGIGYKYLSNFSGRIAFFCNDSGEYSSLFDYCRERIENIPGRCIVEVEKAHMECQTFLAFEGEKEIDRVGETKRFIAEINQIAGKARAFHIPEIPDLLTAAYVHERFASYMDSTSKIVVGINYDTVSPLVLDFQRMSPLAITGREGSGRHNFVEYVVNSLEAMYPNKTEVYVVDSVEKKLEELKGYSNVKYYSFIHEDAINLVTDIEKILKSRYEAMAAGNSNILNESALIVLILDGFDALEAISNDTDALNAYHNITSRYKNLNVCIIASGFENTNISYSAPTLIKEIRDGQHFMYFDDISNMKLIDIPISSIRAYKKKIEIGDGYYIKENICMKCKTVKKP